MYSRTTYGSGSDEAAGTADVLALHGTDVARHGWDHRVVDGLGVCSADAGDG